MNALSFSGAPRIALTSLLTWESAAQTCPQVPEPCVKVATISSANSTTYFYRVVNTSPFKITGLDVGFDSVADEALLPYPPMSGTAPSGWTWKYVRTEEEARWHASWVNPEPGIPAGTTLAGFSLTTTANFSKAYTQPIVTVYYGVDPVSARAQVEGRVHPIKLCVEPLSGGAFNAYFSYSNTNTTEKAVSIGPANLFSPGPEDRGQPITFQPGNPAAGFAVQSNGEALTWTVEGTSVTARSTDHHCN
jgi:hypothetical protein